jgi:hypothetical protein
MTVARTSATLALKQFSGAKPSFAACSGQPQVVGQFLDRFVHCTADGMAV